MAFDFHKSDPARPLTQFCKEGGDDIKMDYIFWTLVKVMTAPPAQDVKKDLAVNEYEQRGTIVLDDCHIKQDLEETGCFWLDGCKGAADGG